MRKGFTLLELIIVIIIIGILAVVGFTQYQKTMEKARSAEAREVIGGIRTGEHAYYFEFNEVTSDMTKLLASGPTACQQSHWYAYSIAGSSGQNLQAVATRCTTGGKSPNWGTAYSITLDENVNTGVYTWTGGPS